MRRAPHIFIVLAAVLIAMLAMPATGSAAKPKVPFGFFGTVLPHSMTQATPTAALDQQMALMARSGVESLRVAPAWEELEPRQGVYQFRDSDRWVAAAARHGLKLLVNVTSTPRWASTQPLDPGFGRFPPRDPAPFGALMRQLVLRYGKNGSFWAQNPGVPRVPVRQWQIWNEQTARWNWDAPQWAPGYTKLLKAAYQAIHGADRGAKVVAGSFIAPRANYAPWDQIRDLYRAGAKRYFDVISVHPFTNDQRSVRRTAKQTLLIVERVRRYMRKRGDRRKPIILTEVTWPAAVGKIPNAALLGLETTSSGQVARVKYTYPRLVKFRRKLNVTQTYWYTWASEFDPVGSPSVMSFRYAGLVRKTGSSVFGPMPILKTWARVARKYERCHKTTNARRCG